MVDYKHPVNPGLLGSRWHDPKRRHLHMGDDYRIGTGHTVRAIADGVVKVVNQHRLWGFHVQIEHADGRVSSYHQLQRLGRPWVGDRLRQGDAVGLVGNPCIGWTQAQKEDSIIWAGAVERDSAGTLVSTGPHFHLGILEAYGKPWINPATVITTKATATAPAGGSGTPIPEDDMYNDDDRARDVEAAKNAKTANERLDRLARRVGGTDGGTSLTDLLRGIRDVLGTTHDIAAWVKLRIGGSFRGKSLSVLLGEVNKVEVTPEELIAGVAAEFGDDFADRVAVAAADEADRRARERIAQ